MALRDHPHCPLDALSYGWVPQVGERGGGALVAEHDRAMPDISAASEVDISRHCSTDCPRQDALTILSSLASTRL